ncbi:MAG TPA: acetyltransferase [Thermotogota bacterium]|nr:acetyltransferase [Thermotogota bacterium]
MNDQEKILIVGDGEFAEIAYEYFMHDTKHAVLGFCAEKDFKKNDTLFGLPVYNFEEIQEKVPSEQCKVFVAITYTQLNRVRTRLYREVKKSGYKSISYISSKAFVWNNAVIGENCFIFENNVIQYRATIGNNCILWSGNHIGHRAVLGENVFLSSHVVVSGYTRIGDNCFVGVNSSFGDNIEIGEDCLIGAGSVITKNAEKGKIYKGNPAQATKVSSYQYFGLKEDLE